MNLLIQWHLHLKTVYEELVVISSWGKVLSVIVEFYAANFLSMLLKFLCVFLLSNIIQINFRVSWTNKQIILIKTQGTHPTPAFICFKNLRLFFIVNYVHNSFIVSRCQKLLLFVPRDAAEKYLIWILQQLIYVTILKVPNIYNILHSNCQIITLGPVNKV